MVFQSYAIWPHMTVAENVGFPLSVRKVPAAELARQVGRGARHRRARRAQGPPPLAAVGRAAAARGAGAGHRRAAEGAALRRAALQPRRQAARGHARRDPAPAARARRRRRLRHARPGGGAVDVRPRHRHGSRADPAGRHPEGALSHARPTASWRISSAARASSTWRRGDGGWTTASGAPLAVDDAGANGAGRYQAMLRPEGVEIVAGEAAAERRAQPPRHDQREPLPRRLYRVRGRCRAERR